MSHEFPGTGEPGWHRLRKLRSVLVRAIVLGAEIGRAVKRLA